ncbi:MAG TPA: glycosyltransferase family 2 protein [Candidatus Methylacidiphilales bacterium]|jgi:glycosyltransferase involved in cell wall biosynthesis|nr:glycosyltransferase family 2 protein [Candidatus Methylacidiphilales bacterium]
MKPVDLAVVMPVYNEEANIEAVVSEWAGEFERLGISFALLAINDGSKDGTGALLQTLAKRYGDSVRPVEKGNAGHGQACRTGYALAVESGAEWTLQIDSDGQCDPRFFASFWSCREEAAAVFGVRTTRDDGVSRALISAGCRIATSLLCGIDLKDANVPYRLIRTSVLKEAMPRIPDDFDMQNVALTLALKRQPSVRWKYVPIHFRDRQGGTNSINLRRIAQMGRNLLRNLHKVGG